MWPGRDLCTPTCIPGKCPAHDSPDGLPPGHGQVPVGSGLVDGDGGALDEAAVASLGGLWPPPAGQLPAPRPRAGRDSLSRSPSWNWTGWLRCSELHLDLVAPASEVAEGLDGHAHMCLQGQRVDRTCVQGLNGGQLLLVLLHELCQPGGGSRGGEGGRASGWHSPPALSGVCPRLSLWPQCHYLEGLLWAPWRWDAPPCEGLTSGSRVGGSGGDHPSRAALRLEGG